MSMRASHVHGDQPRLKVLTCGSVDDGKSTLIGRLLYDSGQVADDILKTAQAQSPLGSTGPDGLDFAFLLDGLEAEREQGITIDVSYRTFATRTRVCQIADCPGHEQYTRNMATAASNCDAAIVLIDARRGVLPQTLRHLRICALMGLKHIFIAINKMDMVDWSQASFETIKADVVRHLTRHRFCATVIAPIAALHGDNVIDRTSATPWYQGDTLLAWLDGLKILEATDGELRLPIQNVVRPSQDIRAYLGTVLSGELAINDTVSISGLAQTARITALSCAGKPVEAVHRGDAVAIELDRDVDLSRGDVIVPHAGSAIYSDQLAAEVIWFSHTPLTPGRQFWIKGVGDWTLGRVSRLRSRISLETGEEVGATVLNINEIGVCNIVLSKPILCDPYQRYRKSGGFIIVDTVTNESLGVGLILFDLRRAANITPIKASIETPMRQMRLAQKGQVLWFTGLSGSGKSTIAGMTEMLLWDAGRTTAYLDGDNLRSGLCQDLGFNEADRVENVRRTAHAARLMIDAGLVVICALISPFRRDRDMARTVIGDDSFVEIFVDTSVETCMARDPKGLYAKALNGLIPNFTGITAPYERPENPEILIKTEQLSANQAAQYIVQQTSSRIDWRPG